MLRYVSFFATLSLFEALYLTAIANPLLPSSTFTYAGYTVETIFVRTDRLALVRTFISAIVDRGYCCIVIARCFVQCVSTHAGGRLLLPVDYVQSFGSSKYGFYGNDSWE